MARYEVFLGDKQVHDTSSEASARAVFDIMVKRSVLWMGACGGKPVRLTRDGETIDEHPGGTP